MLYDIYFKFSLEKGGREYRYLRIYFLTFAKSKQKGYGYRFGTHSYSDYRA